MQFDVLRAVETLRCQVKTIFGWQLAKRAQLLLLGAKLRIKRYLDKLQYVLNGARSRELFVRQRSNQ
jgi:hypothetical protein